MKRKYNCEECNDKGWVTGCCSSCNGTGEDMTGHYHCSSCKGKGEIKIECPVCGENAIKEEFARDEEFDEEEF